MELAPYFGLMDVVQPDLGRSGLTETLRIAQCAGHAQVVPHVSIALGPQIAAAIHAAAAMPNCSLCEYNPAVFEVSNRYLTEPLEMNGPAYLVPAPPGLGIEIDEQRLRRDMQ
jgi:galactonate dehydratase